MANMIAIHQIVTREKKGGPRIVIPPGSCFDSADYPMISAEEWRAMSQGEHPIVRAPDDPTFVVPAAQAAAAAEPVTERRSPRTDLESQAARAEAREEAGEGDGDEAGEGDGDEAPPRRRSRRRAADDEV